jgi:hypothetical protein
MEAWFKTNKLPDILIVDYKFSVEVKNGVALMKELLKKVEGLSQISSKMMLFDSISIEDIEEASSVGFKEYEYIKKFHNNVKKIIIQKEDEYIHIYPLKHHDENVYVIIESKIMLDVLEEKEILMRVHEILEKYFENIDALEKETNEEEAVIA